MITTAYKRLRHGARPKISLILLDWSCRESFHSLDYLSQQNAPRDDFEIIWIEFYDRRSQPLEEKIIQYVQADRPAPVDLWLIMNMPKALYYHKHLMYNVGIACSSGDILVICDSDAMFPPNFIETVIDTFAGDEKIVLHLDEVRNTRPDLYPFKYPSFEEMIGPGALNWRDGKTTGLWDTEDPIHTRNYGACFCAKRSDVIAIGGADEDLDYLGHVCGPNEMTFRLVNKGWKEVWHDSVFLYHTWHPGSDGEFNYIGPNDGRNVSATSLAARDDGRIMPLVENAVIRAEREGRPVDGERLINPKYFEEWTEEAVSRSPRFRLFKRETGLTFTMALARHNILEYQGLFYGVPHELGPVDLSKPEDRARPGIVRGDSVESLRRLLDDGVPEAVTTSGGDRRPEADRIAREAEPPPDIGSAEAGLNGADAPAEAEAPPPEADAPALLRPTRTMLGRDALGGIAEDLVNLAARSEITRRQRNEQIIQLEQEARKRSVAFDQLRATVERKDQAIAALQRRLTAVERERADAERDAVLWRQHVAKFPAPLDLLPLLRRKTIAIDRGPSVFVPADAEPGHFLYGPYIQIEPGSYRLELRGEATTGGDDAVARIEVLAGPLTLAEAELSGSALMNTATLGFTMTEEAKKGAYPFELRLSHLGHSDLRMVKVRLHIGATAEVAPKPVPAAGSGGAHRSWLLHSVLKLTRLSRAVHRT